MREEKKYLDEADFFKRFLCGRIIVMKMNKDKAFLLSFIRSCVCPSSDLP